MGGDGVGGRAAADRIRTLVAAHPAADQREQGARRRILEELDHLDAPCDEHAGPVHVTASAIVVGRRGTVLHRHRRLGLWLQPGGHIEPGEEPWQAATREATEETGLDVRQPPGGPRLVHVDVHRGARDHTHLDLRYLVLAPDSDPAPPPEESQEVRWCSWDEAQALADDALVGALAVARRQWDQELQRA